MKRYRKKERVYQESEQRLELEREWNDEVMYRVMIGLWAAAVLAAFVLFLLPDLRAYVQDRPCILRQMTGLYCPGCGGTRAVLFLLHGQVGKSFYYNPAISYAILFAFAYMISHTLKHVTKGRIRGFHYRNGYCYLGVALFVANWVWKNYMLLIQHQMLIP